MSESSTGVPAAMASSGVIGRPSTVLASTSARAFDRSASRAASNFGPTKRTSEEARERSRVS
jgi:hypothetical protein